MSQTLSNESVKAIVGEYKGVDVCITGSHIEVSNKAFMSKSNYTHLAIENASEAELREACEKATESDELLQNYINDVQDTLALYINAISEKNAGNGAKAEDLKAAFETLGTQLNNSMEFNCQVNGSERNFDLEEIMGLFFNINKAQQSLSK